jgi:hypothetical protein
VLGKEHPPDVTAIIDEAVVRRIGIDTTTMREQLKRLMALGTRPNITIQILPFAAGISRFPNPFAILQFPDPDDSDVMYVESALADEVIDRPDVVAPYRIAFERLREQALSPAATQDMLQEIVGGLD